MEGLYEAYQHLQSKLRSMDTRGSYQPAAAVAAAGALRWVPYDEAVSAVRGLLGASHEDLRLRSQQLSRSFTRVFFRDSSRGITPFAAHNRFSVGRTVVCADRPPLAPALQAVNRALLLVSVNDASQGACDGFYGAVDEVLRLLVGKEGRCTAAIDRAAFEAEFALEWVPKK